MNETEKDRILRMVAEGTLRPHEAAHLLAALADEPISVKKAAPEEKKEPEKEKLMEVQMQRADGTFYTIKVPPGLMPMIWEVTKATIKEQTRTAAQETWQGFKNIVKKKSLEARTAITDRFKGSKNEEEEEPVPLLLPAETKNAEGRRQILQMVQGGLLSAEEAGRLIQQLDAHLAYQKSLGSNSSILLVPYKG